MGTVDFRNDGVSPRITRWIDHINPDAMMPSQWADRSLSSQLSPEQRLYFAIFADAVEVIMESSDKNVRAFNSALRWVRGLRPAALKNRCTECSQEKIDVNAKCGHTRASTPAITFATCCDILELPLLKVKAAVLAHGERTAQRHGWKPIAHNGWAAHLPKKPLELAPLPSYTESTTFDFTDLNQFEKEETLYGSAMAA